MSVISNIETRYESCPIPEDAQADWGGTIHYEIGSESDPGYW